MHAGRRRSKVDRAQRMATDSKAIGHHTFAQFVAPSLQGGQLAPLSINVAADSGTNMAVWEITRARQHLPIRRVIAQQRQRDGTLPALGALPASVRAA